MSDPVSGRSKVSGSPQSSGSRSSSSDHSKESSVIKSSAQSLSKLGDDFDPRSPRPDRSVNTARPGQKPPLGEQVPKAPFSRNEMQSPKAADDSARGRSSAKHPASERSRSEEPKLARRTESMRLDDDDQSSSGSLWSSVHSEDVVAKGPKERVPRLNLDPPPR